MLFLLIATVALTGVNGDVNQTANVTCPGNWTQHESRCFLFVDHVQNWAQAEQYCRNHGANLASGHNIAEVKELNKFVERSVKLNAWIGGSDCQEKNQWFWYDGTPFDFKYWCPSKPDGASDHCCSSIVHTEEGLCWTNLRCNSLYPSICAQAAQ